VSFAGLGHGVSGGQDCAYERGQRRRGQEGSRAFTLSTDTQTTVRASASAGTPTAWGPITAVTGPRARVLVEGAMG
jgi:hypothetical protein